MNERPELDRLPDDEHSSDTGRSLPLPPSASVPPPARRPAPPRQRAAPVHPDRPGTQPGRRRSARQRREQSLYLPLWSIGATLLVVLAAVCGIVLLIISLGGNTPEEAPPVVIVNSPMPTATLSGFPASPATPTIPPEIDPGVSGAPPQPPPSFQLFGPTLEAIATSTPTRPPLTVGVTVIVMDVAPDQLNVRDTPGTRGTSIVFRANEGTRFTILDGPQQADGLTWWRIQNQANANEVGWAASNYLEVAIDQ